jgi:myosin heavy chain 6/7
MRSLVKLKSQLNMRVEEASRCAEEETRAKSALGQQLRSVSGELAAVKAQLDEESAARNEAHKACARASGEAQLWRSKYEADAVARAEEVEEVKRKLAARIQEAGEQVCSC